MLCLLFVCLLQLKLDPVICNPCGAENSAGNVKLMQFSALENLFERIVIENNQKNSFADQTLFSLQNYDFNQKRVVF